MIYTKIHEGLSCFGQFEDTDCSIVISVFQDASNSTTHSPVARVSTFRSEMRFLPATVTTSVNG